MAAQNINLFRDELAEKRTAGNKANSFAVLAGLAVFGIAGHVGLIAYQIQTQKSELMRLNTEFSELNAKVGAFTAKILAAEGVNEGSNLEALENRIKELQARRNALEVYLNEDSPGFSDFLIAMARQHVQGMWLTGIGISNQTRAVELDGASTRPELVTEYLSRLNFEPELNGIQFRGFRLSAADEKAAAAGGKVQFRITTEELDGLQP